MPSGRAIVHTLTSASALAASHGRECHAAAAAVLARTGGAFLHGMAHHLTEVLPAPLVVAGELEGQTVRAALVLRGGHAWDGPTLMLPEQPSQLVPGELLWLPDGIAGAEDAWRGGCLAYICAADSGIPATILAVGIEGPQNAAAAILLPLFAPRVAESLRWAGRERRLRGELAARGEELGRLAGGVAHDFNNLLMIMLGYAEMLRDQHGDSDEIGELLTAGTRAGALVRQLLAYGRRVVLHPERLDMNGVAARVQDALTPVLPAHVQMTCISGRSIPAIRADAAHLERIVMQLALGARDVMSAGGRLTIATSAVLLTAPLDDMPAGRYARVSVSDSGPAMPPDRLAHVFEPFSTTKGPRGSGLELASIRGIVSQSGGYIHCDSEPGRGTTFHIHLPAAD
jgi:signal transduction histidine kinase